MTSLNILCRKEEAFLAAESPIVKAGTSFVSGSRSSYVVDYQRPFKVEPNIGTNLLTIVSKNQLSQPEFGYAGLSGIVSAIVLLHS